VRAATKLRAQYMRITAIGGQTMHLILLGIVSTSYIIVRVLDHKLKGQGL
jgi:hypothetical protein